MTGEQTMKQNEGQWSTGVVECWKRACRSVGRVSDPAHTSYPQPLTFHHFITPSLRFLGCLLVGAVLLLSIGVSGAATTPAKPAAPAR